MCRAGVVTPVVCNQPAGPLNETGRSEKKVGTDQVDYRTTICLLPLSPQSKLVGVRDDGVSVDAAIRQKPALRAAPLRVLADAAIARKTFQDS